MIRPSVESENPRLSLIESSSKISSNGRRSSTSDLTSINRISFDQRQFSESFTSRFSNENLDSIESLFHVHLRSTSSNFPIDNKATKINKSILAVAKESAECLTSNEESPENRNMNISDDTVEFSVVLMKKVSFSTCTMALKTKHLVPSVASSDEHEDEKV